MTFPFLICMQKAETCFLQRSSSTTPSLRCLCTFVLPPHTEHAFAMLVRGFLAFLAGIAVTVLQQVVCPEALALLPFDVCSMCIA